MPALFKKLAPDTARLHTLFHRHLAGMSFAAGGASWRVEPSAGGGSHGATLYGRLGDGEFTVWLGDPDWRVAAASVLSLPPDGVDGLPEPLLRAALECFADDLLSAVERGVGLPASLTRLEIRKTAALSSACFFTLFNPDGLRLGGAWAAAPGGDWAPLAEKALAALPGRRVPLPGDLPLTAMVSVAMWRSTLAELESLRPGDVALSPAGGERIVVVGGRYRFAAALTRGVLQVEGKTMTDATPAQPIGADAGGGDPAAATLDPVGAVEVELQAHVGSLTVSLADLRRLGAGQVVEFSTPTESPATLVVNGRAIAVGELVDVGGRVGVRIVSMSEG